MVWFINKWEIISNVKKKKVHLTKFLSVVCFKAEVRGKASRLHATTISLPQPNVCNTLYTALLRFYDTQVYNP